jgi:NADH:ubiquinone oxidoreductase subunit 3 (subunit A)
MRARDQEEFSVMQVNEWIFVAIAILASWVFPAMPLVIARFLQPRRPTKIKQETYECGIETVGTAWVQFKVQYYLYALVFLVFDIEVVFLFPWAVAYNQLPLFAFVEMLIFVLLLGVALAYAWRKGALEWG